MRDRAARIDAFLAAAGWGAAARTPLGGDASFRRYLRLRGPDGSAVLMDAPPPREDVRPFQRVATLLTGLGFSAPRIFAADTEAGLLLLEDFGDATFARALAEGAEPEPLYALATDTLIALHRAFTPEAAGAGELPEYDEARLIDGEAMLLPDWYMPAVGVAPTAAARTAYREAWRKALRACETLPRTLVLRDYFPDNLMLLEGREGVAACGLLDFQDAVLGCRAYDLLSLLQDARRDVPEDLEDAMLRRYLDAFPDLPQDAFRAAYTVLAAQRHAKVIGIFTRLAHRDGKPRYLAHIHRLWRLMDRALAHPALAPVKAWLDAELPVEKRIVPATEAPA